MHELRPDTADGYSFCSGCGRHGGARSQLMVAESPLVAPSVVPHTILKHLPAMVNRPISARFYAMLWMSSGGSPMTLYRTICVRMQGKYQVAAWVAHLRAAPLQ